MGSLGATPPGRRTGSHAVPQMCQAHLTTGPWHLPLPLPGTPLPHEAASLPSPPSSGSSHGAFLVRPTSFRSEMSPSPTLPNPFPALFIYLARMTNGLRSLHLHLPHCTVSFQRSGVLSISFTLKVRGLVYSLLYPSARTVWHTVGPQQTFVKRIHSGAWGATLIQAPKELPGDLYMLLGHSGVLEEGAGKSQPGFLGGSDLSLPL